MGATICVISWRVPPVKKWLFWSHGLAFVLGGVMTFLVLAAIANVEANRRYQEAKATREKALAEEKEVLDWFKKAETRAAADPKGARLGVLLPSKK
jgi:hypothetical protein